jgi:hypothetical protein
VSKESRDINGRQAARPGRRGQLLTTRVGLIIPPGLRFEEWADAGPKIGRMVDSFAWCLGDWLVFGQNKYDRRYAAALERVGLDYQTMRNYAWVARKVPIERRRAALSFQHHAEVASLPPEEQDSWLSLAEENSWTRNELRRQRALPAPDGRSKPAAAVLPQLQVETTRIGNWRRAADLESQDFAAWIIDTLDSAAAQRLTATESRQP